MNKFRFSILAIAVLLGSTWAAPRSLSRGELHLALRDSLYMALARSDSARSLQWIAKGEQEFDLLFWESEREKNAIDTALMIGLGKCPALGWIPNSSTRSWQRLHWVDSLTLCLQRTVQKSKVRIYNPKLDSALQRAREGAEETQGYGMQLGVLMRFQDAQPHIDWYPNVSANFEYSIRHFLVTGGFYFGDGRDTANLHAKTSAFHGSLGWILPLSASTRLVATAGFGKESWEVIDAQDTIRDSRWIKPMTVQYRMHYVPKFDQSNHQLIQVLTLTPYVQWNYYSEIILGVKFGATLRYYPKKSFD